ncbi:HypC/HybG/HupF family hydrogenase formation chaperone [Candidatus Falkowbacteria bacterium]|nr:HypC/HybG/HupF family hydrogenase formation chaperone [Candidatus Falkowbacteria bacterium]
MCIGIPQKVLEIKDKMARVQSGDHEHWLDISTIDDTVCVGDYLLSYQGAAINKIAADTAREDYDTLSFRTLKKGEKSLGKNPHEGSLPHDVGSR